MAPHTVLLVDEDSDTLEMYSLMLEHHGYRVVRADSAEEGFRAACEEAPSLVVTELFLGGHRQEPLLVERLKRDPRTLKVPVVAVSARMVGGDHPGPSWCDLYLAKPCIPTRLLREVGRLLDPSSAARPPA